MLPRLQKLAEMISYYVRPVWNQTPQWECQLDDIARYLREGRARQETETLRTISDPEERRNYKRQHFDFVTFSGSFRSRKWETIRHHTGLLCFDFDHLGSEHEIRAIKERLIRDTNLRPQLIFTSPSGDGLKLVTQISKPKTGDPEELMKWHKLHYMRQKAEIEYRHGLESDKTSDITRTCYLGWDPEAWIYQERKAYPESNIEKLERATVALEKRRQDVTRNYNDWIRLGFGLANEFGETGREYYHRISRYNPNYTRRETNAKYNQCLQTRNGKIGLGTILWLLRDR